MSVALVTGGSRGIGKAIALKLAGAGYDIAICYAGNAKLAGEVADLCREKGVKALAVRADVKDKTSVDELIEIVRAELGQVEVLVNNAGITRDGLLLRMNEEDFEAVIDTNLKGTFLCTKAVLKDMMKAKKGSIINISSVVGLMGNAGQSNYAASKAGIIGFTKSVAREYGAKGIRVNAIAPGFIETEMTESLPEEVKQKYYEQIPLKRLGSAEDVANLVEYLASEKSAYITGEVISVNGGMY